MKSFVSLLFALVMSSLAHPALAADPAPALVITDAERATATIVDVNKKDRSLRLRNEQGQEMTMTAGPEVRNFDQIKKGDLLEIEYRRAAASELKKADKTTSATSAQTVEVAPKGAKPGMVAAQTQTIVAEVKEIDQKNRLLTVQGPRGGIVTVKVPAELKTFDGLKKGDLISAQYTEAVAIAVRTPSKKK
jgi:hypothetical protein